MRVIFLIVASAAVLTQARPDLTLGYDPNAPKDNYDGPLPDHDAFGVRPDANRPIDLNDAAGASLGLFGAGDQLSGTAAVGYNSDSNDSEPQVLGISNLSAGFTSNGLGQNTFDTSSTTGASNGGATFGAVQPTQSLIGTVPSQKYASDASQPNTLPPIITKSFYFESAPEEPEEENQAPRYVHVGRPQKNYKVIFIKAPTYGLNAPVIPIVPPNEEKTIIYVLSKKPEFKHDIELPPVPTTEAIKPDVFFIKYKSEKEAHDAQHGIQAVYEQNTDADGNAQFEDGHLQSIAHAAFPNVVSGTGSTGLSGPGASYEKTNPNVEQDARIEDGPSKNSAYPNAISGGGAGSTGAVQSGTSDASANQSADTSSGQGSGYTILSGTDDHDEDRGQAEASISHEASALQPEYLPPGGRYRY